MTALKHSPGPWTPCFSRYDGEIVGFHITAPPHGSAQPICESSASADPETMEGNAHLLAAAFEMRAALEAIVQHCNDLPAETLRQVARKRARAALFKADGR